MLRAPATVHKCYQVLSKILAAAVEGGMIPRSPCRQIPLPRIERAKMQFLTVAEVVTEMHGHLYLGPPKTLAGRRRVGLPRVVVEALQEHLADRSIEPDGFVFALSNGGPLRTAELPDPSVAPGDPGRWAGGAAHP